MTLFNLKNTEVASRTPCGWDASAPSREQADAVVQTRTSETRPPPPSDPRELPGSWAQGPGGRTRSFLRRGSVLLEGSLCATLHKGAHAPGQEGVMLPLSQRKPVRPPWASTPRSFLLLLLLLHRVTAAAPSDPPARPAPSLPRARAFCRQTLCASASPGVPLRPSAGPPCARGRTRRPRCRAGSPAPDSGTSLLLPWWGSARHPSGQRPAGLGGWTPAGRRRRG